MKAARLEILSWVKSGNRSQNVFPGKTSTQKIIIEANKTTLVEGYWALAYQSPTTFNKMADRSARKRAAEREDEFFRIRAKGQFLKVPKGQDYDDREVTGAKGLYET